MNAVEKEKVREYIRGCLPTMGRHPNPVLYDNFAATVTRLRSQCASTVEAALEHWNPPPMPSAPVRGDAMEVPDELMAFAKAVLRTKWRTAFKSGTARTRSPRRGCPGGA